MKTNIILTVLVFLIVTNSQAQLLKKLKNRIEQKVENVIVEKASDKAAEKASKSMDKVFDINPFGGGKEKADPASVADTYDFTWKYVLKMTSKDGDMVFDYYLKPEITYFGFETPLMGDMFMIMDNGNNIMVTFMQSDENNIGMVSKMNMDLAIDESKDESTSFRFETLADKTIMGFLCKGMKATNERYEIDMYFTNEAPVSFDDIYKNQNKNMPSGLENYFKDKDHVLMMHMYMNDLKNDKHNAVMECIGLEEVKKTIIKSNYKFM
ncbi:DUF4412 domain-containing protein [Mariniflexile sp.]|uniref:DUF4412 domain-containing protein n=1 Tax=Mariniflexile sp. TaxID=1979402 RepID=UPI003569AC4F